MQKPLLLIALIGCATNAKPPWLYQAQLSPEKVCGFGMAGPGFGDSPYPKKLAEERATRNLAGVLETLIEEGVLDRENASSVAVETARRISVDPQLVAWVAEHSESAFWRDEHGEGPFAQDDFTYAHTCIDAHRATAALAADLSKLRPETNDPTRAPSWLHRHGEQPHERLCAVGFSMPTFYPEEGFGLVVEDVRAQLAQGLRGFFASYASDSDGSAETILLSTYEAVSRDALVSHYWFDLEGIGPHSTPRSTYGWGCITHRRKTHR